MTGVGRLYLGQALMLRLSEHLHELMEHSLLAWRLDGDVTAASDGVVVVRCRDRIIRIERAPPDLPFRWHVAVDGRKRAALSLVAVLRQAREALDPGYATLRPRIAPVPLVPAGPSS
jgi:hypothetical protein